MVAVLFLLRGGQAVAFLMIQASRPKEAKAVMSVQRSQKNQYTHQGNDLVGFWSLTVIISYMFCSVFCHLTELDFALDERKNKKKVKNKKTSKPKKTN